MFITIIPLFMFSFQCYVAILQHTPDQLLETIHPIHLMISMVRQKIETKFFYKVINFDENLKYRKFSANDCLSDRKLVLEDSKTTSEEKFYIPQCTPDGRYHRVQCYSGYCWCVYQDTGKPIPGTSSKTREPNCTPVSIPVRPMSGKVPHISS